MFFLFFFNDSPTTEIYTLSLHDALPILAPRPPDTAASRAPVVPPRRDAAKRPRAPTTQPRIDVARARYLRSEEHTSELQSHSDLVCRLLLEKKKNKHN